MTGSGDIVNAGGGNDIINIGSIGTAIAHGDAGDDTINGSSQTTYNESLYGDDGNDMILGNGGRDFLYGGNGNDVIKTGNDIAGTNGIGSSVNAGAGDDKIYSGGSISWLNGEAGNDTFYADQGLWTGAEDYDGGADYDRIVAQGADQNIGIANITDVELITGNGFSNVNIQSKNVAAGKSTLLNLTGITLVDIAEIHGQNGNDAIYLQGAFTPDDPLLGRNDVVRLGSGNDTVYAGFGDDRVFGEAGNDLLLGGAGKDTLSGGQGADTFWFTKTTDTLVGNADIVTDFSSTEGDKIDLSSLDADTVTSGDQAFAFIGSAAFSNVAGQLRSETDTSGITHIFGDWNGDSASDFEITLQNGSPVTAADLIL